MSDDLRSLFDKARFRSEERGFVFGLVGKHNIDATVSYAVVGRSDFLYVTVASKTVIIARNDAGVPQTEDYPVKLRRDSLGIFVIVARATNSTLGAPIAIPPSGVVAHATSHKHGGSDEVATATPAANAIVKADADGKIGAGWIDDADINLDNVTEGTTNKFFDATEQSKLAGIEALADVTDATNIASSIHGATLDVTPLDADEVPGLNSSVSFALIRWTWTNIKAFLKTYFDTLYNNYVHPNHSGDVTSVADGATTIANNAVTYAKMQDVSVTDRFLGRDTAGAGDVEEIAPAAARTMLNVADGANAYVHPNHSGDVTSVADGATTIGALKVQTGMVAASAITYAKIQNVSATDKLLGRATAGAGVIEEIALTAYARTLIAAIDAAAGRTVLGLGTMAVEAAATYGPLAAANTWAGTNKFDDTVTLSAGGTQDYELTNSTTVLRLQSKTAGAEGHFWFFTNDGDGTDSINISMYGVGTPSASANRERLRLMWNQPNSAYEILTEADGTGTLRPLVIYTEGNTDQLRLGTDGKNGFSVAAPTGKVSIQAGTSTGHANAGGVLYVTTATVGNVGTGEDTLASFSVPANTLAVNGQSLWFEAWGTQPNNLNTKMLRARFGSAGTNLFFSKSISEGAIATWFLRGRIYRTGAATQKGHASVFTSNAAEGDSSSALNQTLSGAITFSITGEATANNDIVCEGFIVGWDDNHA